LKISSGEKFQVSNSGFSAAGQKETGNLWGGNCHDGSITESWVIVGATGQALCPTNSPTHRPTGSLSLEARSFGRESHFRLVSVLGDRQKIVDSDGDGTTARVSYRCCFSSWFSLTGNSCL
jgi:hypothetical protein